MNMSGNRSPRAPGQTGTPKTPAAGSQKQAPATPFSISIEKLIVHKYSEHAALLAKADKVAQQLIHDELRDGEFLQVQQPGRYLLHFPNLRADARELRGSVIAEKIYRVIRDLNPTAKQLAAAETPTSPTPTKVGSRAAHGSSETRAPAKAESARDEEMRKQASAAMAAMTGTGALSHEELLMSPLARELGDELTIEQWPVWYANQSIIIGHDCVPMAGGESLRNVGAMFRASGANAVEVRAIIDALTYERVAGLFHRGEHYGKPMGLVICPVHASTLGHPKYVSAFLAAGSKLPAEARKYLMFLVKEFPHPVSRLKVRDAAGYLAPRARSLLVDLPLHIEEVNPAFREFGFRGARATLADFSGDEAAALKHFNTFAELCERARLQTTIDGWSSRSLAVAARAAGFSYLSGTAISADMGSGLHDFDLDSLFQ
jgi:hypothetical protein